MTSPDLVEAHVRALGNRLRGPVRARRDLLAEVRAGLLDAVDARVGAGADQRSAQRAAVAEFGAPAELAPVYQARLVALQGRRTALLLALAFPGLVIAWDLLPAVGLRWPAPPSSAVRSLARVEDLAGLALGGLALVALLVLVRTARRGGDPVRTSRAIGLVGGGGALLCAGLAVAMNVLAGPAAGAPQTAWTAAVPAYTVSVALLVVVLCSASRTIWLTSTRAAGRRGPWHGRLRR